MTTESYYENFDPTRQSTGMKMSHAAFAIGNTSTTNLLLTLLQHCVHQQLQFLLLYNEKQTLVTQLDLRDRYRQNALLLESQLFRLVNTSTKSIESKYYA